MVKNKKLSWSLRILSVAAIAGACYPLYNNISDQSDINAVFDSASGSVQSDCIRKTSYDKTLSFFNKTMRDSYHKCIVDSKDPSFKAAAAKYILDRLSKNGENEALKELKQAIDG